MLFLSVRNETRALKKNVRTRVKSMFIRLVLSPRILPNYVYVIRHRGMKESNMLYKIDQNTNFCFAFWEETKIWDDLKATEILWRAWNLQNSETISDQKPKIFPEERCHMLRTITETGASLYERNWENFLSLADCRSVFHRSTESYLYLYAVNSTTFSVNTFFYERLADLKLFFSYELISDTTESRTEFS